MNAQQINAKDNFVNSHVMPLLGIIINIIFIPILSIYLIQENLKATLQGAIIFTTVIYAISISILLNTSLFPKIYTQENGSVLSVVSVWILLLHAFFTFVADFNEKTNPTLPSFDQSVVTEFKDVNRISNKIGLVEFLKTKNLSNKVANLDFSDSDLSGLDLSNAIFMNVNFERSNLTNANFKNSIFRKVNFRNSDLTNSNFKHARITTTLLVSDSRSDFSGSNLTNANFAGSYLSWTILTNCDFTNAIFIGAELDNVTY